MTKYCPACHNEFQDWVENCIDCGTKLVDTLPEPLPKLKQEPKYKPISEPLVSIASYQNHLEA